MELHRMDIYILTMPTSHTSHFTTTNGCYQNNISEQRDLVAIGSSCNCVDSWDIGTPLVRFEV
jgi:hypothetical protein